jgi:hypothetical protein
MPEMDARLGFGFVVAVVLTACVPTLTGRVTPAGSDTGEAPHATAAGPATPAAPSPAAGSSAAPSFVRPTPNPNPTFLVYEVRAGDSLSSIARLFGTTARSIAFWNRDRYPSLDPDSEAYEPDRIKVGWTLLLIPTEVVTEDDLPDPTPTPNPTPVRPSPGTSSSPS